MNKVPGMADVLVVHIWKRC